MRHPYATLEFARSLAHIGEAVDVPEWGTPVLVRSFRGRRDAIGPYPITALRPGADIAAGVGRLAGLGLVSVVLVIEDSLTPDLEALRAHFEVLRPLTAHYRHDRAVGSRALSKHHRYEVRRALRNVSVERFDLAGRLSEWRELYRVVAERHGLAGTHHDFPVEHHEALASLPGVAAIGAFVDGRLVSCHIWVCHAGHAMSHLAATSEEGYELGAAYAVNAASIDLLTEASLLNFGGAAGGGGQDTGLARFKRGFANATGSSWLCGSILDRAAYASLRAETGTTPSMSFFPAYRQGTSAANTLSPPALLR